MHVFLSWSGDRSRAVAETLQEWLPRVINAVEPWMSPEIPKGRRWGPEIAAQLGGARVGIVCLTPENRTAPWLLFESGALAKTADAQVCTFLYQLRPTDVEPPLSDFQHTLANRSDVRRLLSAVNSRVAESGERSLAERLLDRQFEVLWPELEVQLSSLSEVEAAPVGRAVSEMTHEILALLRDQDTFIRNLSHLRESAAYSETVRRNALKYELRFPLEPAELRSLLRVAQQVARLGGMVDFPREEAGDCVLACYIQRPVPPQLLVGYAEDAGLSGASAAGAR